VFLARIRYDGPDGEEPRIVASSRAGGPWIDVRTAERRRLERRGATSESARRISASLAPGSMAEALGGGEAFLDAARAASINTMGDGLVGEDARFIAPLDPPLYRDFMAFEGHFSFGYRWRGLPVPDVLYEFPVSYVGGIHGFLGPGDEVPWPHYTRHMDYELELGIVIGREGRNLDPEAARERILGVTILNDFSARDIQLREMTAGLGPSKGKHFASAIGPWIATLDELPSDGLRMTSRINGETWCDASSAEMIWSISEIVAWASAGEYLAPGMLLGSGTANGGSGIELGRSLNPGDLVELEIECLGILRNRMGSPETGWTPQRKVPISVK
jgi:2-keto-4-pentenoate hydratase/2-oxohepta-3-ene-1,7-dioic acid hydratase in catechol pathway